MNIQEKAVSHIIAHPHCSVNDIMGAVPCGKSVAYAAMSAVEAVNEIKSTQRIVGVFSCLHEPASVPGGLEFIQRTFKKWGVTDVVCLGDLIDHHFISRHVSEPDALSPIDELDLAVNKLKKWSTAFPNVKVTLGNHDQIPTRQAKRLGIPARFIRSLNEIYELPKTWEFTDHVEIDDVWYEHGVGSNGQYGAKNTALKFGMSYVQGHTHANGAIHHLSLKKKNIFGLNVGCLMDVSGYAGRYAKKYKNGVSLGCGIVIDGEYGLFIPFKE